MPLYEYKCPACGTVHEAFSTIAKRDRADVSCPSCGKIGCKREVGAAAVVGSSRGMAALPSSPAPT